MDRNPGTKFNKINKKKREQKLKPRNDLNIKLLYEI